MSVTTLSPERAAAVAKLNEERMRGFEQMAAAGGTLGVPAALHHCVEHQVQAPAWLVAAALELLCDQLKRKGSGKRGRAASIVARYRQDQVDFIRWNEVWVLSDKQRYIRECFASDPTFPAGRWQDEIERAEWLGKTKSKVFECVADVLERTEAFGSPCSIKRSYLHVERQMKNPATAWRYYWLDHLFLQKLGIDSDLGYGKHATIAAWRKHKPQSKRATSKQR